MGGDPGEQRREVDDGVRRHEGEQEVGVRGCSGAGFSPRATMPFVLPP
jgi:hypothetical protein